MRNELLHKLKAKTTYNKIIKTNYDMKNWINQQKLLVEMLSKAL